MIGNLNQAPRDLMWPGFLCCLLPRPEVLWYYERFGLYYHDYARRSYPLFDGVSRLSEGSLQLSFVEKRVLLIKEHPPHFVTMLQFTLFCMISPSRTGEVYSY